MNKLESHEKLNINLYHPIPFEGYDRIKEMNRNAWRLDCENRFRVIKDTYGDIKGKSLIDIGCANGYFLFRFVQEGGRKAVGIEIHKEYIDFINLVAKEEDVNVVALDKTPDRTFDIGIFLDLHHKDDITISDYPDYIGKNCETAFVSCTNNSGGKISDLLDIMGKYYKKMDFIYNGFQDREIYKCWDRI